MKRKKIDDNHFMREAIRLARKGIGKTSPNPIVGAVIVRNGKITGRGYHKKYGDWHAEINAIKDANGNVKGATLYITLEPCCHYGKTPPCVETLIKEKIERVVVGTLDPNPMVNGKGIKTLRSKGIKVDVGILEDECRKLNTPYFKFIKSGIPYVTVKYAQTLDGRIAKRYPLTDQLDTDQNAQEPDSGHRICQKISGEYKPKDAAGKHPAPIGERSDH